VKKTSVNDFKVGNIFKYKGKGPHLDQSGTACVTSLNDKYVSAEGIDGYYEEHQGLGFFLEHYDLFLEEEVWVEDLPEVEVVIPGPPYMTKCWHNSQPESNFDWYGGGKDKLKGNKWEDLKEAEDWFIEFSKNRQFNYKIIDEKTETEILHIFEGEVIKRMV